MFCKETFGKAPRVYPVFVNLELYSTFVNHATSPVQAMTFLVKLYAHVNSKCHPLEDLNILLESQKIHK